jgi:putative restriction endonuclease
MRFWWVNHKQTVRHEIDDSYLWSPKRTAKGARNHFYDNMRQASPGDAVLSFADGLIRYSGIVIDYASPAPKPDSFESVGSHWSDDGWLLPVAWQPLSQPVRPKDRIAELGPLLPEKYSPIQPDTGNGNQGAYLAEVDKSVYELLVGPAGVRDVSQVLEVPDLDAALARVENQMQKSILDDPTLDATTKKQLVSARYGQGLFRRRIYEFERACRLTSVENPRLLIASHIKPWRSCSSSTERLDGANGLLLAPHVDRLFDRGLISFKDDGEAIISPQLDRNDLCRLGLMDASKKLGTPFHPRQVPYLAFHRENVLLP